MPETDPAGQPPDDRLHRLTQEWRSILASEQRRIPPAEQPGFVAQGLQTVHGLDETAAFALVERVYNQEI
jgi:hypothetical protein